MTPSGIKPFPTLWESYDIFSSEIFRYLKIKHFFTSLIAKDSSAPSMSIFEQTCKSYPHRRGLISALYSPSPSFYAPKWESDLEWMLHVADWNHIWQATKSSSQNIVVLEANYKVLTHWYLVPARISKYVSHYPSNCFKGCAAQGSSCISGGYAPQRKPFGPACLQCSLPYLIWPYLQSRSIYSSIKLKATWCNTVSL